MQHIRNFAIIAHIDHGKSTLADRFIQLCNGLSERRMESQVLDSMDIERERGITIKAQSVSLRYQKDGQEYQFNIIDTPGHVDFGYEVSRSLSACEAALLVVDAVQGVEAQSVANCYAAIDQGLEIISVLNKTDLPAADPERVKREIENIIGIDASAAVAISAKTGAGVSQLLENIVTQVPFPRGSIDQPLRALIIDSWFDNYIGIVALVRVFDGRIISGEKIQLISSGEVYAAEAVGIFTPDRLEKQVLETGEVGFVITGVKDIHAMRVGDTLTSATVPAQIPLPGFKAVKPRVFAGVFPTDVNQYASLRDALDKLSLNDASLHYMPESSQTLGLGFRCGFLGILHMEIIRERLEREYGLSLITTAPTVVYRVVTRSGEEVEVHSPSDFPAAGVLAEVYEPMIEASILLPKDYLGSVIQLCISKRGQQKKIRYTGRQVAIEFELPLNEVVFDFFDRLNSVTRGYASFDYRLSDYQSASLVKLDILINGDTVDALAAVIHRDKVHALGRDLVEKMKDLIPRQMFDVAIQAAIGSQVVSRATVKALRKNVTAKCYGGDVTRKRKLLEKQKAGKKRMKRLGKVDVPQEAFLSMLKVQQ